MEFWDREFFQDVANHECYKYWWPILCSVQNSEERVVTKQGGA